jgi:glycosyltransferase involved in cell wall biosynthesis
MFDDKKVVVTMPVFNAAQTLKKNCDDVMTQGVVDLVIVVDDAGADETVAIAKSLPNTLVHTHPANKGYGANQKTCYKLALKQRKNYTKRVALSVFLVKQY